MTFLHLTKKKNACEMYNQTLEIKLGSAVGAQRYQTDDVVLGSRHGEMLCDEF